MNSKVFLRNWKTGQYYAGSNGWSGQASVAHDFDTAESAIELARTHTLEGMEVVVRFGHPDYDLILPLRLEPQNSLEPERHRGARPASPDNPTDAALAAAPSPAAVPQPSKLDG